jgi:hypothetical protein
MLRSLEQRSPLNIYVGEADKNFNIMKVHIAIGCIVAIHRMFVPNANIELYKILKKDFAHALNKEFEDAFNKNTVQQVTAHTTPNKQSDAAAKLNAIINKKISDDKKAQKEMKEFEKTKLDDEKDVILKGK